MICNRIQGQARIYRVRGHDRDGVYKPTIEQHEYSVQMVENGYSMTNRLNTLAHTGGKAGVITTRDEE